MISFFRKNRYNGQAGFSVLELLIVISILTVFSVMAYSRLNALIPSYRINAAARAVRAHLVEARSRAAKDMRQYRIAFVAGGGYQLQLGNARTGSTTWDGDIPHPINEDFSRYQGVSLNVGASIEPIFNPNGTVQQTITITIDHDKGKTRTIGVSLPGRIRIN